MEPTFVLTAFVVVAFRLRKLRVRFVQANWYEREVCVPMNPYESSRQNICALAIFAFYPINR
ncbi:hypothetical protein WH47_06848 [Habropoda laboriosa]|uniref:Uncharacterized protein n=1 Tax=Habropoda laboriosa TaxID=597456 RepID=A0A0L7RJ24_9HYME|nr:hypothetical protein WH47_06848 [Habropoda laboriosa]